jgi:hypothetical protein
MDWVLPDPGLSHPWLWHCLYRHPLLVQAIGGSTRGRLCYLAHMQTGRAMWPAPLANNSFGDYQLLLTQPPPLPEHVRVTTPALSVRTKVSGVLPPDVAVSV